MSLMAEVAAELARLTAGEPFADATLTRAGGTYDPITRTTTGSTVTLPCRAVAGTVTVKSLDGTSVTTSELTVNVEPRKGDKLTLGATTYLVGEVRAEAPNGLPLIWIAVAQ